MYALIIKREVSITKLTLMYIDLNIFTNNIYKY